VDIWPGWVDALSTLIMVIMFVLMVFVLAQFTLTNALAGRDRALADLNGRLAELADQLGLERTSNADLQHQLASLTEQLQATLARRDELQSALDAAATERAGLEARLAAGDEQLAGEKQASAEARAQVDLLNQQMAALRQQLAALEEALQASEKAAKEQKAQIVDLGQRLNAALAGKVAELARYRSEFFGRLRELLGERSDVRVVGDRFVFQSEVLFESGSADLGAAGREQLAALARTLLQIAATIPGDVPWILRVDGHTDAVPIRSARFPSNWELSTARAIAVVKFLAEQGVPSDRLAAAGFGEFQPLDDGTTAEALARNRRIEIKLDSR
jgi:chemotaxis protein MotB